MKRRKKLWATSGYQLLLLLVLSRFGAEAMLLLTSNCLTNSPGCLCSWKSGKFVADCQQQNLTQVPKNDYYEYLQANNQMSTLNRDIQQLNLASNNISHLARAEFVGKRFRNLQKIHLNQNGLLQIHPEAFQKLTGLVELDLSENQVSSLTSELAPSSWEEFDVEQTSTTNEKKRKLRRSASFLKDLVQLRLLNLNSNQLSRLDKFAFSPLVQLRQLFLSRNQISSIDKRAFDGLDVLNILHLDGNKLAHLAGSSLLRLPQLHAVQLGGLNPWRCDCRLRKLVRLFIDFLEPTTSDLGETDGKQLRLLDEPQCAGLTPGLWKNMNVAKLDCRAQLARSFLAGRQVHQVGAMNMDSPSRNESSPRTMTKLSSWQADELLVSASEHLELTCAARLEDELELEHQQVEWWRIVGNEGSQLMWRSASTSTSTSTSTTATATATATTTTTTSTGTLAQVKGDKFAVIDYVTRANRTLKEEEGDGEEEEGEEELVRVTHLLVMNGGSKASQEVYLCRVINQLNSQGFELRQLVQRQNIKHDPFGTKLAAGRTRGAFRISTSSWPYMPSLASFPTNEVNVSWAMRQLRGEQLLATTSKQTRLFVPLYLPEELRQSIAELSSTLAVDSSTGTTSGSVARSLLNQQQQEPRPQKPRQTSAAAAANGTVNGQLQLTDSADDQQHQLASLALNLIRRYTSNQRQLMQPAESRISPAQESTLSLADSSLTEETQKRSPPAVESWLSLRGYMGDGSMLLLLGLGFGLFAGCLLSLLFAMLRLKCSGGRRRRGRRRRVACQSSRADCAPTDRGGKLAGGKLLASNGRRLTPPLEEPEEEEEAAAAEVSPSDELDMKLEHYNVVSLKQHQLAADDGSSSTARRLKSHQQVAQARSTSVPSQAEEFSGQGGEEADEEDSESYLHADYLADGWSSGGGSCIGLSQQQGTLGPRPTPSGRRLILLQEQQQLYGYLAANPNFQLSETTNWSCPQVPGNSCEEAPTMEEVSSSNSLLLNPVHLNVAASGPANYQNLFTPATTSSSITLNQSLTAKQPEQQQEIVYLEDALQLLHHSMSDCYLLPEDHHHGGQHFGRSARNCERSRRA